MFLKITFLVACLIALSACEECNETCPTIPRQYEELGCKPVIPKGQCCPTSFECPDFNKYDKTKCYYKGKTYASGESLPDDLNPRCQPGCRCSGYGENLSFVCAHVDCPEFFGGGRGGPECVSQYNLDSCCRSKLVCDDKEIKALAKCEFEGKSYKEGQRIYPEKDSCYSCICAKDWDPSVPLSKNKNCKKYDCGHELRHLDDVKKGCVPVFFGDERCCSIQYRCPQKTDSVDSASLRTAGSTDTQCKYGDLTLNVGQEVKTGEKCVKCKCDIPPMVTCSKVKDCQD